MDCLSGLRSLHAKPIRSQSTLAYRVVTTLNKCECTHRAEYDMAKRNLLPTNPSDNIGLDVERLHYLKLLPLFA